MVHESATKEDRAITSKGRWCSDQ